MDQSKIDVRRQWIKLAGIEAHCNPRRNGSWGQLQGRPTVQAEFRRVWPNTWRNIPCRFIRGCGG